MHIHIALNLHPAVYHQAHFGSAGAWLVQKLNGIARCVYHQAHFGSAGA